MASWTDKTVTNNHILPYVDSNEAGPEVAAALRTLPFERNIFKVTYPPPFAPSSRAPSPPRNKEKRKKEKKS